MHETMAPFCKHSLSAWHSQGMYISSHQESDALWVKQEGRCGVCGKVLGHDAELDHNHETGLVRGWLCHLCNVDLMSLENYTAHWTDAALARRVN